MTFFFYVIGTLVALMIAIPLISVIIYCLWQLIAGPKAKLQKEQEEERYWRGIHNAYFHCPKCVKKTEFKNYACYNCNRLAVNVARDEAKATCSACGQHQSIYCPSCDCKIHHGIIRPED